MASAPHSPLLERATTGVIESERTKYPMQRFVARRYAQAALEACHAEELAAPLRKLVAAKDEKETNGDTPLYRQLKVEGWREARALLAKLDGKS